MFESGLSKTVSIIDTPVHVVVCCIFYHIPVEQRHEVLAFFSSFISSLHWPAFSFSRDFE